MANDTRAYIQQILAVDATQLAELTTLRAYAEGDQSNMVTTEQAELLGEAYTRDYHPQVNICSTILKVESTRLNVLGQEVDLPPDTPDPDGILIATLKNFMDATWNLSHMDLLSDAMHYGSLRDGDGYIIVDWDHKHSAPRLYYNQAYDGQEGCHVCYSEPTNPDSAIYAFKVWETFSYYAGIQAVVKRLTIYWHNRAEDFVQSPRNKQWEPYVIEGDGEYKASGVIVTLQSPFDMLKTYTAAVQWNTVDGTPTGEPLGIPVFHYPHEGMGMATGVSAIHDVAPALQDDINVAHINVLMASQLTGGGIYTMTGGIPPANTGVTSGGSVSLKMSPGAIIWNSSPTAAFGRLEAGDITQLIEVKNDLIKNAATITSTPLTFFNITGQLPAEGTLQSLQDSLVAKVKRDQKAIGTVYAAAAKYALILEWAYGDLDQTLIDLATLNDLEIYTLWESPEPQGKGITIDEALKKQQLGIPDWQLWLELGYSTDDIKKFNDDALKKRNAVLGAISLAANQAQEPPATVSKPEPKQLPATNGAKADMPMSGYEMMVE